MKRKKDNNTNVILIGAGLLWLLFGRKTSFYGGGYGIGGAVKVSGLRVTSVESFPITSGGSDSIKKLLTLWLDIRNDSGAPVMVNAFNIGIIAESSTYNFEGTFYYKPTSGGVLINPGETKTVGIAGQLNEKQGVSTATYSFVQYVNRGEILPELYGFVELNNETVFVSGRVSYIGQAGSGTNQPSGVLNQTRSFLDAINDLFSTYQEYNSQQGTGPIKPPPFEF